MSSGFAAASADAISEKDLKKLCPVTFKVLEDTLKDNSLKLYDLYRELAGIGDEILEEKLDMILELFDNLVADFKEQTDGLELSLEWHESEDGDCYDSINGRIWTVDGAWEMTPAAKALAAGGILITHESWVVFG